MNNIYRIIALLGKVMTLYRVITLMIGAGIAIFILGCGGPFKCAFGVFLVIGGIGLAIENIE